jgi:hypothetical protein
MPGSEVTSNPKADQHPRWVLACRPPCMTSSAVTAIWALIGCANRRTPGPQGNGRRSLAARLTGVITIAEACRPTTALRHVLAASFASSCALQALLGARHQLPDSADGREEREQEQGPDSFFPSRLLVSARGQRARDTQRANSPNCEAEMGAKERRRVVCEDEKRGSKKEKNSLSSPSQLSSN